MHKPCGFYTSSGLSFALGIFAGSTVEEILQIVGYMPNDLENIPNVPVMSFDNKGVICLRFSVIWGYLENMLDMVQIRKNKGLPVLLAQATGIYGSFEMLPLNTGQAN